MVDRPAARLGKVELAVGQQLTPELHAVIAGFLPAAGRTTTPSASAYQEALLTNPHYLFGPWPVPWRGERPRRWLLTEVGWEKQ